MVISSSYECFPSLGWCWNHLKWCQSKAQNIVQFILEWLFTLILEKYCSSWARPQLQKILFWDEFILFVWENRNIVMIEFSVRRRRSCRSCSNISWYPENLLIRFLRSSQLNLPQGWIPCQMRYHLQHLSLLVCSVYFPKVYFTKLYFTKLFFS